MVRAASSGESAAKTRWRQPGSSSSPLWISSEQTTRSCFSASAQAARARPRSTPGRSGCADGTAGRSSPRCRLQHGIDGGEIPQPAARVAHQRRADHAAAGIDRRAEEGRVDRRRREHRIARLADGAAGDVEPRHQARQPDDPLGIDCSRRNLRAQVADHRFRLAGRGMVVAEHAVPDALAQGLQHRRRRGEIHVGDPQRNDIAPGVLRPFHRVAAGTLDRLVESRS
jgi:hypothetical protein